MSDAPAMALQPAPLGSHRCHWYASVSGGVPVQVPGAAVSVEPPWAEPEMVGAVWFAGGAAAMAAVAFDVAVALPPGLLAVIWTARSCRTRVESIKYVDDVAPEMLVHAASSVPQ